MFQCPGGLNSDKKAIVAIKKELHQYDLLQTVFGLFGSGFLSIGNQSVIDSQSIQGTGKGKGTGTGKGTGKGKEETRYDPVLCKEIHKFNKNFGKKP